MIKIGVVAVGYKCHKRFNEVMAPWAALKCGIRNDYGELIQEPNKELDITICVTSALFKERYDMGERYDNEKTENLIKAYHQSRVIDDFHFEKDQAIIDFESRNSSLGLLALSGKEFDLIWQLDLYDEVYTQEQILNIVEFVKNNSLVDWYKINFKNYVGDEKHWIEGFCPPRIHWVKKHGGIKKFVWDNDLEYNNGKKSLICSSLEIPQSVAFVKHYSWCGTDEFLKRKIAYQKKAIGTCSFKWNEEENKIDFDKNYYAKNNLIIPTIYEDP